MPDKEKHAEAGLPKPPPFDRRVCFPRGQFCGLLLLATLPVLAAFGVFGSSERTFNAEGGGVTLTLSYTPRLRYGHPSRVKIHVQRVGERALHDVRVRVDTALLARFDHVASTPEPVNVTAETYEFPVEIGTGGSLIVIDLEPQQYGPARGRVAVTTPTGTAVELPLRTFVFP